jgi:2-polyprenyl-3-methyl-5-hydroxy-6-metoxy-1,4-benzoquinol methylase
VELYLLAPSRGEEQLIDSAAGPGGSILELGCGTGRITRPLVALGHEVVAVDESAEMIARITEAETVCSTIEDLRLDRRFDLVLLMSYLINVPDDAVRRRMLATCAYHVKPGGTVLLQQHDRASFAEDVVRENENRRLVISDTRQLPGDRQSATMTHTIDGRTWSQQILVQNLTEEQLRNQLAEVGLRLVEHLDESWVTATPT